MGKQKEYVRAAVWVNPWGAKITMKMVVLHSERTGLNQILRVNLLKERKENGEAWVSCIGAYMASDYTWGRSNSNQCHWFSYQGAVDNISMGAIADILLADCDGELWRAHIPAEYILRVERCEEAK